MTTLLLALVFSAAAAASDCASTSDGSSAACVEANSTSTSTAKVMDARNSTMSGTPVGAKPSTRSTDDEPWTYESDSELESQHVCLTRGAGGICLDTDD
jgi:hypothetical protein